MKVVPWTSMGLLEFKVLDVEFWVLISLGSGSTQLRLPEMIMTYLSEHQDLKKPSS
jgi:hypothetical protein